MAFIPVGDWGGSSTPFQLVGKKPLLHLPGQSATRDDLYRYAAAHLGFHGWLRVANNRIQDRIRLGLLDLPDRLWRDAYDERVHPCEAADDALREAAEELGLALP